jgi:hypothetical protein
MFLAPDLLHAQDCLATLGFSAGAAEQIIEDVYSPGSIISEIRPKADCTVRLLRRAGVLEDPRTSDSFCRFGLL